MTQTAHKATNASNDPMLRISDATYAQSQSECRRCGIAITTKAEANAKCEATGRRHFIVSR